MGILGASNPPQEPVKGLNYIGNHIFGYSGQIAVSNATTTLIETVMGSGYAVLELDFGTASVSSRDMLWEVLIDETKVYGYVSSGTNQAGQNPANRIKILVPGYAKFKITSENQTDTNTENQFVVITGRVYA